MQLQLEVTKPVNASASATGTPAVMSGGAFGEGLVTEVGARYYNLVKAGLVYSVQYASAATAAASATAAGSFALFNPPGSGKDLVVLDIQATLASFTAGTTTFVVGLTVSNLAAPPTSVTGGNTPVNLYTAGAGASIAKTYTAATTVAASTQVARVVAAWYADLAAGDVTGAYLDPIDGKIVIGPGGIMSLVSLAATPTIIPHITWAEIPV